MFDEIIHRTAAKHYAVGHAVQTPADGLGSVHDQSFAVGPAIRRPKREPQRDQRLRDDRHDGQNAVMTTRRHDRVHTAATVHVFLCFAMRSVG